METDDLSALQKAVQNYIRMLMVLLECLDARGVIKKQDIIEKTQSELENQALDQGSASIKQ